MSTAATSVYDWNTVPWRHVQRTVFKLQTRIYRAKRRGAVKAVHRLQRLRVTSRSAKLLAVRRVTQDNRGKRTAGVDGVKLLPPHQRVALAHALTLPTKARPARRVWIPKPGTTEQRPLGIPTRTDRAAQALLKLALEPEWEAVFEPNSYGFRPGRSGHDAIGAIFTGVKARTKYVLDADIAKCFERIRHHQAVTQADLIRQLNPLIAGWSRYYAAVAAKASFADMDQVLFAQLLRWARRRHPRKNAHWVARTYWHPERGRWAFATKDGVRLRKHAQTAIRRHVKVQGAKSPFNGDWSYWARRTRRHPEVPPRVTRLLRDQHGRCGWCGLAFGPEDTWETDHIIPRARGGSDGAANLQLLHTHCHDQKTAADGSSARAPLTRTRPSRSRMR